MKHFSVIIIALFLFSCSVSKKIGNSFNNNPVFSFDDVELINQNNIKTPMRILQTSTKEDSLLLRRKSNNVIPDSSNLELIHFTKRLLATVTDSASLGVGIAAPQVGVHKQIIWVQRFDKIDEPFELYLNPKISKYSDLKQDCQEGCLSVPDVSGKTEVRSYAILLEYDKINGSHHIEMIEGFTAVIFQHEIDHLNGILFTDRLLE